MDAIAEALCDKLYRLLEEAATTVVSRRDAALGEAHDVLAALRRRLDGWPLAGAVTEIDPVKAVDLCVGDRVEVGGRWVTLTSVDRGLPGKTVLGWAHTENVNGLTTVTLYDSTMVPCRTAKAAF